MRVLVQKFGGSSVAKAEDRQRVVQQVLKARQAGYSVVVVVSAMGRRGAPYATDTLLDLIAGQEVGEREKDLLLSCGEIISGVVLVGALKEAGLPAVCLTGAQAGIITDGHFGDARIIRVEPQRVRRELEAGRVVVVAGFQGVSAEGEITTLGRGGSDTTAAALGVALEAEAVEIFTDVDGLKTADPHIVEDAKTLRTVTYNELCQLAYEGARVIHPRAVEIAREKNIPLRIRSTFNDDPGTLVVASQAVFGGTRIGGDRLITGITNVGGLTQLRVKLTGEKKARDLFCHLASEGISVDFINLFPDEAIFTVSNKVAERALASLREQGFDVEVRPNCAKVAAVGAGMRGVPGVMAAIVTALAQEEVAILQSADSYTSIWCLVDEAHMEKAVRALHRQFKLSA
ncbi:aspartate kinase [Thermanaeromonas sp. C210]|uniref:aspartate kinase n=1 Tax=Thermanaeromonas sp. C210 TaxID=2731925 RepID=UPI00155C7BD3|nr:aspartate kinase [Thermanaeromonas sp. C210]GFN23823.1 aspartokinase [Thermanaeromonas sp. C210]